MSQTYHGSLPSIFTRAIFQTFILSVPMKIVLTSGKYPTNYSSPLELSDYKFN